MTDWDDDRTVTIDLRTHSGTLFTRKLLGSDGEMTFTGALSARDEFLERLWRDIYDHGVEAALERAIRSGHITVRSGEEAGKPEADKGRP